MGISVHKSDIVIPMEVMSSSRVEIIGLFGGLLFEPQVEIQSTK